MREDPKRIVLARRKRSLAANDEFYVLLVDNDLLNAPSISFSGYCEIQNEAVSEMCGGPGIVHPIMLVVRRSGYRVRAGLCRGVVRRSISKVEAEVEAK